MILNKDVCKSCVWALGGRVPSDASPTPCRLGLCLAFPGVLANLALGRVSQIHKGKILECATLR